MAESDQFERWHISKVRLTILRAKKRLTCRRGQSGAADQANALEAEGVVIGTGRMGERLVSLQDFGHFPDAEED
jgi:hypothetical protein